LNEAYHRHETDPETSLQEFREEKEAQLSQKGWNWFGEGSERTVGGLGKTLQGASIYETFERVVVKFDYKIDPSTLSRDDKEQIGVGKGNTHEIAIWKWACDHDDEDLFATVLDYSEYGDWLVQKYYIPVYPNRHRSAHARNGSVDYLDNRGLPNQYKADATRRGYDPHIKDGNIGYDPVTKTPVCIDFGNHFKIDGVDADGLLEHTLR